MLELRLTEPARVRSPNGVVHVLERRLEYTLAAEGPTEVWYEGGATTVCGLPTDPTRMAVSDQETLTCLVCLSADSIEP